MLRGPPRFRDSLLEEALVVAGFVGSTALALAIMAGSVAAAGLRAVMSGGLTGRS